MINSFRYESEMTDQVTRWMSLQGLWVQSEYATPSGPCDLVGVAFREEGVRRRLGLRQVAAIRDVKKLVLLEAIPNAPGESAVSLEELARYFAEWMGASAIRENAAWLVRKGFLEESGRGFQRVNHYAPLEDRILAVEIKLRRVRDALHQALQRRSFATETVIALPKERALALLESSSGHEVRERGVGVLAVEAAGCDLILQPTQVPGEAVHPVLRALCVERFWSRIIRA